jgi:hypothetical protein
VVKGSSVVSSLPCADIDNKPDFYLLLRRLHPTAKMFYEIAKEGTPTQYELSRLRSFEITGRMNNFLMQSFDTGTDVAFMLVLFGRIQRYSARATLLTCNCNLQTRLAASIWQATGTCTNQRKTCGNVHIR